MGQPLRVILAEDSYLLREGTRQLLEAAGDVEVVAAVENAVELLDAVARSAADAVLTDIRMPPGHHTEGIDAAHEIRRRHGIGVVVLSQYADVEYAIMLFRNGSAGLGYLLKERVGERSELVRALRETAAGASVVDPLIVDALVAYRTREAASPLRELSEREHAVLAQMARGSSNAAIAHELHVSASAVEKHINAVFTKLGLAPEPTTHRRVAAVLTYLQHA